MCHYDGNRGLVPTRVLTELMRTLKRYWYVVLAGLLVSVLLGAAVVNWAPPEYETERSILFVPSPTSEDPDLPQNPLFSFINADLNTPIQIVSIIVSDEKTVKQLAPEGSGISYSVGPSTTVSAPVMDVKVTAPSAEVADATAKQLTELVQSTLRTQQEAAGGPKSTWMTARLISSSIEPTRVWGTPIKLAVGAFGLCVLATFGVVALLQRRSDRRRRRDSAELGQVDSDLTDLARPTAD